MPLELSWGRHVLALEVPERQVIALHRQAIPPPLPDPAAAVRDALENPISFPPLRRALTPDDQIAIAVDESLADPAGMLIPILEYLRQAGIACQAITLICRPPSTDQPWIENLPDEFQEVRLEVHAPGDRKRLSYLATTKRGRRVYLNRTAVDADQLVLLTRLHYDTRLGYGGGEGDLFPALGDEATLKEAADQLSTDVPGVHPWRSLQEAHEVAWLLGAPFFVQIIEGSDPLDAVNDRPNIAQVLAGPVDSCAEGERALDDRWRVRAAEPADVVVACIGGDPARHTFTDLARAFHRASRVVKPHGRIVVLSDADPALGRSGEIMRLFDDPHAALKVLTEERPADHEAGYLWAHAAQHAKLYLLSKIPDPIAEELFVTPLEHASQVSRMIDSDATCLVLPDAHKALAVVDP